jgi:hypothetical protein
MEEPRSTVSEQGLRQAVMDDEHLRLLRIGYFVMAGMKAFMSLFGLLYAGIGLTAFTFAHAAPPTRPGQEPPPEFVGWIFAGFGLGFFVFFAVMSGLCFLVARRLRQRRSRVLCLVVAAIDCVSIPYGTLLGVFTFVVLARPTIMRMFETTASCGPEAGIAQDQVKGAPPVAMPSTATPAQPPEVRSSVGMSEQGDATGGIIPYKNPHALIAYYCGVFSLIPCLGLILGPTAVILGVSGLRKRTKNPLVRGQVHACIGIVLGSLVFIAHVLIIGWLVKTSHNG